MKEVLCLNCGKARTKKPIYFKGKRYCNRCLHTGKIGTQMPLKNDKGQCACGKLIDFRSKRCMPCYHKERWAK